jgi:hypothetical protein
MAAWKVIFNAPVDPGTRTRGRSQLFGNSAPSSGSVMQGPPVLDGKPNIPATSCDTPTSKMGSGGKSVHRPTHGSGILGPVPPKPPMLMLPAWPPVPFVPAVPEVPAAGLTPAHPAAPTTATANQVTKKVSRRLTLSFLTNVRRSVGLPV